MDKYNILCLNVLIRNLARCKKVGMESFLDLLMISDEKRKTANSTLLKERKSKLGQYMTPSSTASFMTSLFPEFKGKRIKLLDPGAGVGSLTLAFINRFCKDGCCSDISVTSYEVEPKMKQHLEENLNLCGKLALKNGCEFFSEIKYKDFIQDATRNIAFLDGLWKENVKKFTHCIMNPPYKKILSSSAHRSCLSSVGIETVNLYSAFVALSVMLMEENGHLVAIVPRSFCNGPYYRPFRKLILEETAIRRIHLFESRNKAFKDDKVLQENIIIVLEKNGIQKSVEISTSTDDTFSDLSVSEYDFNKVVKDSDNELFIHIPTSFSDFDNLSENFKYGIEDIGVNVSTGPVVDFRLKEYLREMPDNETVPLLYSCHFKKESIVWPIENGKKPNAIISNSDTEKWLYPSGFYTVVRRFSSKEEKHRIVASIVDPDKLKDCEKIGFENHLNVFHSGKSSLDRFVAKGLAIYLNSTVVDRYFRCFSGHTQVNATDLRLMKYPDRNVLKTLGEWGFLQEELTQEEIDEKIEEISK